MFTLESANFSAEVTPDGQNVASATYDMQEITAKIVAAGTVTAETDLGSLGTSWSALPLTLGFTDRNGVRHVIEIQTGYREGAFVVLLQADLQQDTFAGVLAVNGYRVRATVISAEEAEE